METILLILCILASILLIAVVLVQPGKADMVSGMGGLGGQMTNLLGVRQGRNILQNITIGLALFLIVTSIVYNKVFVATGVTPEATTPFGDAPIPVAPATQQQPAQQAPQPAQQPAQPAQQQPGQ